MAFTGRKAQGSDRPQIEAGIHKAICVDLVDHGLDFDAKYQKVKPVVAYMFITESTYEGAEGDVFHHSQWSRRFNATLFGESNAAKFLEEWRGKSFTDAEKLAYDWEAPIGQPVRLRVVESGDNGQYRDIASIEPLEGGANALSPELRTFVSGFVRGVNRPKKTQDGKGQSYDARVKHYVLSALFGIMAEDETGQSLRTIYDAVQGLPDTATHEDGIAAINGYVAQAKQVSEHVPLAGAAASAAASFVPGDDPPF